VIKIFISLYYSIHNSWNKSRGKLFSTKFAFLLWAWTPLFLQW